MTMNFISEPTSGFQIAFNMFDTDGNERVDKTEFLVVRPFPFLHTFARINFPNKICISFYHVSACILLGQYKIVYSLAFQKNIFQL